MQRYIIEGSRWTVEEKNNAAQKPAVKTAPMTLDQKLPHFFKFTGFAGVLTQVGTISWEAEFTKSEHTTKANGQQIPSCLTFILHEVPSSSLARFLMG